MKLYKHYLHTNDNQCEAGYTEQKLVHVFSLVKWAPKIVMSYSNSLILIVIRSYKTLEFVYQHSSTDHGWV